MERSLSNGGPPGSPRLDRSGQGVVPALSAWIVGSTASLLLLSYANLGRNLGDVDLSGLSLILCMMGLL